jgi:hypothetical protein
MIRRVVTGEDQGGTGRVQGDEAVAFSLVAGAFKFAHLWGGDSPPGFPQDGAPPSAEGLMPGPGGYRFVYMRIEPSRSLSAEEAAAEREMYAQAGVDKPDGTGAGMHRTDTVDLGDVIEGVIAMELGNGEIVELRRGDVFVQNGVYHRWFNPGEDACEVVIALIGGHPRG